MDGPALSSLRGRQAPIDPARVGLTPEVVRFQARGELLTIGAWHLPAPGAAQAVIIAYDSGTWQGHAFAVDALGLAAHLLRNGVTVLLLDLRDPSERGATRMAYSNRERRDLLGAVDWLLARGYAPGAIGVIGASMGAIVGIRAANEEPAIGALIVDSACPAVRAMLWRHSWRYNRLPLSLLPDRRLLTSSDLLRPRPAQLLHVFDRRPALIFHTRGDQFVPIERSRPLVRVSGAELWVADCASYLVGFGAEPHACLQQVIRFLGRALVSQPPLRSLIMTYSSASES